MFVKRRVLFAVLSCARQRPVRRLKCQSQLYIKQPAARVSQSKLRLWQASLLLPISSPLLALQPKHQMPQCLVILMKQNGLSTRFNNTAETEGNPRHMVM